MAVVTWTLHLVAPIRTVRGPVAPQGEANAGGVGADELSLGAPSLYKTG